MDTAEGRQEAGVHDQGSERCDGENGGSAKPGGESAKGVSDSQHVKWEHGQTIGPSGLKEGLETLKAVLEKNLEQHRAELDRLRKKMSPYQR